MPGLVLQVLKRDDEAPVRLGFTVTKKVGNAVIRNRTKRRLREAARLLLREAPIAGADLVLIGRDKTRGRAFAALIEDLRQALARNGLPPKPPFARIAVEGAGMSPAAHILRGAVRAYQLVLAPLLGGQCRFTPSCSAYAREALAVHGALRGAGLAARRVLRCSPLCAGGHDPVPASKPDSSGRICSAVNPEAV